MTGEVWSNLGDKDVLFVFSLLLMVNLLVIKHLLLAVMIGYQIGGMNAKQDSCVIETVLFQQRPH